MTATGLDRLARDPGVLVRGTGAAGRVGLVANPTSVDARLERSVEIVRDAARTVGGELVRLFGPEHGFWGEAQAGEPVRDAVDPKTGLPVVSLYGERREPRSEMLADLRTLIFDLQDVGLRYYTYLSTLVACAQTIASIKQVDQPALRLVVLDRPNPLGGLVVEGMAVEPGCVSFVGRMPAPARYGLTIGEYARYAVATLGLDLEIEVVPLQGWCREMMWPDTGLSWVPPSPNLPGFEEVVCYGGTCLLEGTNLSEGRGTTLPFRTFGAPWLDADALAADLSGRNLPGFAFVPARFVPTFSKHAGQRCRGVRIHVTDAHAARPLRMGYAILDALRALHPRELELLPANAQGKAPFLDLLAGNALARQGAGLDALLDRERADALAFERERRPFLLYPEPDRRPAARAARGAASPAPGSWKAVGLMSGTSVDGIDAALVEVTVGTRGSCRVANVLSRTYPMEESLRAEVFALFEDGSGCLERLAVADRRLGEAFGAAALALLAEAGVDPAEVTVVGCHGQTVRHVAGAPGSMRRGSVQAGSGAAIALATGIPTVSNFRVTDIAAGGTGAPLVPFYDAVLATAFEKPVAFLNLGGIANVTWIGAGGEIAAFDAGPGNMVADRLAAIASGGELACDKDGCLGSRGRVLPEVLDAWLSHPFFAMTPPKSAGREEFGSKFFDTTVAPHISAGARPLDLLRTAEAFTARSAADALMRHVPTRPTLVAVTGGGAHNPWIMADLAAGLPGARVVRGDEVGLSIDHKEAEAFALFGLWRLLCVPNTEPRATGAAKAVIAGELSLPSAE
jgi:uncharacterized protein YbbC (DUF1343 family)/1,6-anhydro-N-acetylmuramate kinase